MHARRAIVFIAAPLWLSAGCATQQAAPAATAAPAPLAEAPAPSPATPSLTFFVTSRTGSGNLGGLAGADAICKQLATAVGQGAKTWRAYLSADAAAGGPTVNAVDRIGKGPWHNAKGVAVAKDVADLHTGDPLTASSLTVETALDERGNKVPWRGQKPNEHDVLTGSTAAGMLAPGLTCASWTSESDTDKAQVGHHDRTGRDESAPMKSWNASHETSGCTQAAFVTRGGAGRFYCFAAN